MNKRTGRRIFLTMFLVVASLGITASPAAAAPNPRVVHLESVTFGGTGCPQDTVDATFNDDRTELTLNFDEFSATSGDDVPVTEHNKSCQINVNVRAPKGVSIPFATFAYTGSIDLPGDVTGTQSSTYTFEGQPFNANMSRVGGPDVAGVTESSSYSGASGSGTITDGGYFPTFKSACTTVPLVIGANVNLAGPNDAEASIAVDSLLIRMIGTNTFTAAC